MYGVQKRWSNWEPSKEKKIYFWVASIYFEPTSSFGFISTFLSLSHIFWVSAACFSVVNFQARLKEMILLQDLKVELLEAAF